ncbi:M64 family metallopeptidase [Kibdelosporangium aridum]|uniref:IgA Peptidase M64 n=1 Tax=Kibdelosporangium aridum TaxID=2030 RepID=A0A1W2FYG2_KIBAR|nr:M64 family metallopeptidase [Kibdelosporangium aridum]SMD26931.1 IgA Peptidase M64 [Kibdelosporangium aridum]
MQQFSDLVLFPHCDMHMLLSGPIKLKPRVYVRTEPAPGQYLLTLVNNPMFEFFAPNNLVGQRRNGLPRIDLDGAITATKVGVYLFQVQVADKSIVGRLQVHSEMLNWWFGNDSITTALDPKIAHAQPSIYARFKANEGVDEVGDITGHGYVTLSSRDPGKVVVADEGRVRGLVETVDLMEATSIDGKLPGAPDKDKSLTVFVVDYAKPRAVDVVRRNDLSNVDDMQNVIFLPEGFHEADKQRFERTVDVVVDEMFNTRRHEPYGRLKARFNVFRSYAASIQTALTPGFRVTDNTMITGVTGLPIPFNGKIAGGDPPNTYTMDQLVKRVGLPIPGDTRDKQAFLNLWSSQSLDDFTPANVSDRLFLAWRAHSSTGILAARDTFFGFQLGRRWAERYSDTDGVEPPGADDPSDPKLKPFVKRVYSFYDTVATRFVTLDPRRHPPERYAGSSAENPHTSLMDYVRNLRHATTAIGNVWVPEDKFKRSRGLITVVAFDPFHGGTNINVQTIAAQTTGSDKSIRYEYTTDPDLDPAVMHRAIPGTSIIDFTQVADTVAHEFGHSFNLGDEYEEAGKTNDDPDAARAEDLASDNLARLGKIRANPTERLFDPRLVKWIDLPRIAHSARLVKASAADGSAIKVFIKPSSAAEWDMLKTAGVRANLLRFAPTSEGVQLPLTKGDPTTYAADLSIVHVDRGSGAVTLKGAGLPPPAAYPAFGTGSLLFVPVRHNNREVSIVRPEVLDLLYGEQKPLNAVDNNTVANTGPDTPRPIPGLPSRLRRRGLIGVYEGGGRYPGGNFRPAGVCKMRDQTAAGESGEFCHVCKWLIVNRVHPGWHAWLEQWHYPGGQP